MFGETTFLPCNGDKIVGDTLSMEKFPLFSYNNCFRKKLIWIRPSHFYLQLCTDPGSGHMGTPSSWECNTMEFFLNGAELSLNSGYLITH